MFKKGKEIKEVIVLSHVKPIPEKENYAFAKYIYEMSNHHYFQYFMMVFREQMLNTASQNTEIAGLLHFLKLLREKVDFVSKAYLEEILKNEKK